MTFALETPAHADVLATLCRLPFFCARDVMQRVRVTSTIPVMFDGAVVDCVSGATPAQWSFCFYRAFSLLWCGPHCDAGPIFSLAQALDVPGNTCWAVGHVHSRLCCRKVRTSIRNSGDDINNLCCKFSAPSSRAALRATLLFVHLNVIEGGHTPACLHRIS
ncbi:hypothetical protein MRX96_034488 [Rhipicephalus microplus]